MTDTITHAQFGAETTTDEVLADVDLSGRRVLVTGVSAKLGIETARTLVAHGADVVGAARDLDKARRATAGITGPGSLELIECDLASLASVRACADALNAKGAKFDVIIANAGVMAVRDKEETADGFELQFGTNHLGHFVLVNRIARLIADGGRLVNLSSAGHRLADVDLGDPNFERTEYTPFEAYGRSKTANILFAVEFDRRHGSRGVRATAVHPGGIQETELDRHMTEEELEALPGNISTSMPEGESFSWKTIPQGAATSVGGLRGAGWRRWRSLLRRLRGCRNQSGRRYSQRCPTLCSRSRQRQGTLGQERRTGRRAVLRWQGVVARRSGTVTAVDDTQAATPPD